jgi:addiction module RelE/StbE family toxin
MRVRYTLPAQADLEEIYTYVSGHNPAAAERVKLRIKTDVEKLGDLPFIGQQSDFQDIRTRKVRRYPYRIFYAVRDSEVLILHIRHGARQEPWEEEI